MKNCNLDERQLRRRGDVFQHALILLLILVGVNAFLKGEGIVWAEGMYENLLILWAAVALCLIEFVLYDIFPLSEGRQGVLYCVFGLCGLLLGGMSLFHLLAEGAPFVENRILTSWGAGILEGGIMLALFFVYLGHTIYCRKHRNEE